MEFYASAASTSAAVRVTTGDPLPRSGKPRGKIVVSSRPIPAGQVIFREKPLAAMQTVENKALVLCCANCHRFIGDIDLHADILSGLRSRLASTEAPTEKGRVRRPGMAKASPFVSCNPVSCHSACGEVYCSPTCREADAARGHGFLCTGPHSQDHPMVSFKIHAVQTNDIFLFAAKVIADVLMRFNRVGGDAEISWLPYSRFVQEPWWEVVNAPEDAESQEKFANRLRNVAHESYDLLSLSVAEWFLAHRNVDSASGAAGGGVSLDAFMAFFTLDRWGRIIGMFEQNQVGVRVPSPIGALVNKLHLLAVPLRQQVAKELLDIARRAGACDDEHSEDSSGDDDSSRYDSSTGERREGNLVGAAATVEDSAMEDENEDEDEEGNSVEEQRAGAVADADADDDLLSEIEEMCQDADLYFPPLDGMAMFTLACCMNHSCDPNVRVAWCNKPGAPIELELVSLRAIGEGEELCFSYISTDIDSVDERRRALIDYGFECECARCIHEDLRL
jgi:hypothetical protein